MAGTVDDNTGLSQYARDRWREAEERLKCKEHRLDTSTLKVASENAVGDVLLIAMCSCGDTGCAWSAAVAPTAWTSTNWPDVRGITR